MTVWNPWHGCHKISEGCLNCYVYRRDSTYDKDSSIVSKNKDFDLPIRKNRKGEYKIPDGSVVYTCMTSDFFVEDADKWRSEIWSIIKERKNVNFVIITKRIDRFFCRIPNDWAGGYENVAIVCTAENQKRADYRLSIFKSLPIKHKMITCAPILEKIDISRYLLNDIECVTVAGESGNNVRVCDYDGVLDIRNQCKTKNINFNFMQTGAKFKKDEKYYRILRKYQHSQADKANINLIFNQTYGNKPER